MELNYLVILFILNTSMSSAEALDCYSCRDGGSLTEEDGPDNPACRDDYQGNEDHLITCNATNSITLMRSSLGGVDSFSIKFSGSEDTQLDSGIGGGREAPTYLCAKQTVEGSTSGTWRGCLNNTKLYVGNECKNGEMGDNEWHQCICDGNKCNAAAFLSATVGSVFSFVLKSYTGGSF